MSHSDDDGRWGCRGITTQRGFIKSFNNQTVLGKIRLEDDRLVQFDATVYDSGRPKQRPKAGQLVNVGFVKGSVLFVRRIPN